MRPRVRRRHQLARQDFLRGWGLSPPPTHDLRRGVGRARLCIPQFPASYPTSAGIDVTFNLREDEVEEQGRGEETEVDDNPARDRAMRAIGLTPDEHNGLADSAWASRRWEVVPLHSRAAHRNSGLS